MSWNLMQGREPGARRWILGFGLFLGVFLLTLAVAAEDRFMLIAHPTVSVSKLTIEQASDCFLKKDTSWNDGNPVRPVTLADRPTSESFDLTVHRRNSLAIRKYWQRQVFTGRGTPPPQKKTPEEVLRYVSSTPGAIGYVPTDTKISSRGVRKIELTRTP